MRWLNVGSMNIVGINFIAGIGFVNTIILTVGVCLH